jgi:hypothetical protein
MMRPCFCTLGAKHVVGVPEDCFVFTGRRFSRRHDTLKILKRLVLPMRSGGAAKAQRQIPSSLLGFALRGLVDLMSLRT